MLCPHCSREKGPYGFPTVPTPATKILELEFFCRLYVCERCGQFFIRYHPRVRFGRDYNVHKVGVSHLPKACMYYGGKPARR